MSSDQVNRETQWIQPDQTEITVEGLPAADQWVVFNVDQTGYYRVNYDEKNWKLITDQLLQDVSKIYQTNRAQLLDDSWNLARAGKNLTWIQTCKRCF